MYLNCQLPKIRLQEDQKTILNISFYSNKPATHQMYTLSLHDALPISGETRGRSGPRVGMNVPGPGSCPPPTARGRSDRKSTRLNSSHRCISYAVFCLKKKSAARY